MIGMKDVSSLEETKGLQRNAQLLRPRCVEVLQMVRDVVLKLEGWV